MYGFEKFQKILGSKLTTTMKPINNVNSINGVRILYTGHIAMLRQTEPARNVAVASGIAMGDAFSQSLFFFNQLKNTMR